MSRPYICPKCGTERLERVVSGNGIPVKPSASETAKFDALGVPQEARETLAKLREAEAITGWDWYCPNCAMNALELDLNQQIAKLTKRLDDMSQWRDAVAANSERIWTRIEALEAQAGGAGEDDEEVTYRLTDMGREMVEAWRDRMEQAEDRYYQALDDDGEGAQRRIVCGTVLIDDEGSGCWVDSEAMAMANAFRAFRYAGASETMAAMLVRLWLEQAR